MLPAGVEVAEILPEEGVRLGYGTPIRATWCPLHADPKRAPGDGLRLDTASSQPAPARLEDPAARREFIAPAASRTGRPGAGETFPAFRPSTRRPAPSTTPTPLRALHARAWPPRFGGSTSRPATTPHPPGGQAPMSGSANTPYDFDWANREDGGEAVHRPDRALRARLPGSAGALRGARAAGHRGADRPHGRHTSRAKRARPMWEHNSARARRARAVPLRRGHAPAGSVIALNGRNAAMAVLEDAKVLT